MQPTRKRPSPLVTGAGRSKDYQTTDSVTREGFADNAGEPIPPTQTLTQSWPDKRPKRKLYIASGKGNLGIIRQHQETWTEYVKRQREQCTTLPVTKDQYAALNNDQKAGLKKDLPFSIGAEYSSEVRKAANLRRRDTLNIDLDKLEPAGYEAVIARAQELGIAHLHVGSASNEVNGKRSGRLIIPLSRSATPKEFAAASRKTAEKLGIEHVDPVSHRVNQICYAPARCSDASQVFEEHSGPWLDVDATLAEYVNWRDPKQWPRNSREESVYSETAQLGDPRDKPGLVGAFCRAYDFVSAIEAFELPYERTADECRWTPHGASSSGGARIYAPPNDPGFAAWMFNDHEHGLSPKRNVCAYDAVRLHRFGELDKGIPDSTPVSELPSSRAMDEWLRTERPEVVAEAERVQYAELGFENLDAEEGATESATESPKAEPPKAERRARFKLIPVGEFAESPEPEWIVEGVLPRAELAVVYGESGCGKSFFVMDLSLAVARGVPWQGRETVQGKVVYVCGESPGGFVTRLRAYAQHHDVTLADLNDAMRFIDNAPDLLKAEDVKELCEELRAFGRLSVVVIDTLARATPGANENSGEDMGKALKHCQTIHRATGALVVLIHHSGKDQSRGARGWSGIRAATDTEIEVVRRANERRATICKQRDGEDGLQFGFQLVSVPCGHDSRGRELSSLVVKPQELAAAAGKRVKVPTASTQRAVWDALHEAGGFLPTEDLLERAVKKLVRDPKKPDRRRQSIKEAVDALRVKGIVHVSADGDEVSLTTITPAEIDAEKKRRAEAQEDWDKAEAKAKVDTERLAKAQAKKDERIAKAEAKKAERLAKVQAESSASNTAASVVAEPAPAPEPEKPNGKSNGAEAPPDPDRLREMFIEQLREPRDSEKVLRSVADELVKHGYSTMEQVANALLSELTKCLGGARVKIIQTRARKVCARVQTQEAPPNEKGALDGIAH